jgi:hypothetical protein
VRRDVELKLTLRAQPRANVTHGVGATEGWLDIWCDHYTDRADALRAAEIATGGWVVRRDEDHERLRVYVRPPRHRTATGDPRAEVRRQTLAARDAAQALLRERGYSLRGRAGT